MRIAPGASCADPVRRDGEVVGRVEAARRSARRRSRRRGRWCARRCRRRRPASRPPGTPPARGRTASRPLMYAAVRSRAPATTPAAVTHRPATARARAAAGRRILAGQQLGAARRRAPRCAGGPERRHGLAAAGHARAGRVHQRDDRTLPVGGGDQQPARPLGLGDADLAAGDPAVGVRRWGLARACRRRPRAARASGGPRRRRRRAAAGRAGRPSRPRPGSGRRSTASPRPAAAPPGCRSRGAARRPRSGRAPRRRGPPGPAGRAGPAAASADQSASRSVLVGGGAVQHVADHRTDGVRCPIPGLTVLLRSPAALSGTCRAETVTCSTPEGHARRERGSPLPVPTGLPQRRVLRALRARSPRGGWSSCPGRGTTYVTDTPGPARTRPTDRAAARVGCTGLLTWYPLDRAALAALPRGHPRPALARARHPVRGVLPLDCADDVGRAARTSSGSTT